MRLAALGLVFCAGLAVGAAGLVSESGQLWAQRPEAYHAERGAVDGQMIALSTTAGDGRQQVTLIDPRSRVISVYHIDPASGAIALRSVRNVHWDLLMDEFNGGNPSPREIRALLEQR